MKTDAEVKADKAETEKEGTRRRFARREWLLSGVVVLGLCTAAGLARWLESRRPPADPAAQISEDIYVRPDVARRMSLGFNGLVADWYWLRTLQYVGRKAEAYTGRLQLDDLRPLNLRALGPLLEQTTALDPQFHAAYHYGAVVLSGTDPEAAVRLLKKGIAANPDRWRLHADLGYVYWQQSRFREAGEAYAAGARVAGAPAWLAAMAALMSTKGGSRDAARAIYREMFETTEDGQMKELAYNRLLQLRSLDERDALTRLLEVYRSRLDRCPESWRELAGFLNAAGVPTDAGGAPLDPSGAPYALRAGKCEIDLSERSQILRKY